MRTVRPAWIRTASVVAVLLLSAAAWSAASDQDEVVVEMTNTLQFVPDTLSIARGETVEWKNTSLIVHTVTADPAEATLDQSVRLPSGAEPFDSGNIEPGEAFRHTFRTAGTYRYFCIPHEGAKMWGTVIVTP